MWLFILGPPIARWPWGEPPLAEVIKVSSRKLFLLLPADDQSTGPFILHDKNKVDLVQMRKSSLMFTLQASRCISQSEGQEGYGMMSGRRQKRKEFLMEQRRDASLSETGRWRADEDVKT